MLNKQYQALDDTVLIDSIQPVLYSRLNRRGACGIRTAFNVPEKSQGKELFVCVSGRSRNNYAQAFGAIVVITHSQKNELISWDLIRMRLQYTEINKWCEFRDSLKLPPDFYGTEYNLITVMSHLPEGTENFDLDGLKVTIIEKQ